MLHEIPAHHAVAVCHAVGFLGSRGQQDAGVFDAPKREHIPAGVNVERGSLEGAARKRLDASPPLIQAVREGEVTMVRSTHMSGGGG